MLNYLIMRIKQGYMEYGAVIEKFPQYKEEIDVALGKTEEREEII